jgi:CBS domain-containing protein
MLVKEIMTTEPAFARPEAKIRDVAKMMADFSCGEIPVCDDRGLVGVITDRDIACRGFTQGLNPQDVSVRYIMTSGVVTISENETTDRALQVMSDARIARLPVVRDGQLVGVVSASDLVEHMPDNKVAQLARRIAHSRHLSTA